MSAAFKPSVITRLNRFTHKHLGTVGRPVITGAGTAAVLAWGVPQVSRWIKGAPVILSMKVIVGGAVAAVAVTEAGLWFLGDEPKTVAGAERDALLKYADKLDDKEYRAALVAVSDKTEADLLALAANIRGGLLVVQKKEDAKPEADESTEAPAKEKATGSSRRGAPPVWVTPCRRRVRLACASVREATVDRRARHEDVGPRRVHHRGAREEQERVEGVVGVVG